MGSNAPPPPDYGGAAAQMGRNSIANVNAQTGQNRASTNTGFGSTSWTPGQTHYVPYDPSTNSGGDWVTDPSTQESTGLNAPLTQAQGMSQEQLLQGLGQPLDTGTSARDQAVSAMYGAEAQQLNPQWALNDEATQAQLSNEGLSPTSEAARATTNMEGLAKNQAYSQALANAQQLGNQAQGITYGENVQSRELPFQELQGLLGLEAQPNYSQAGLAQTPDSLGAMGLQGNYQLGQQQINNQQVGSETAGLMNLFGSLIGAAGKAAGSG